MLLASALENLLRRPKESQVNKFRSRLFTLMKKIEAYHKAVFPLVSKAVFMPSDPNPFLCFWCLYESLNFGKVMNQQIFLNWAGFFKLALRGVTKLFNLYWKHDELIHKLITLHNHWINTKVISNHEFATQKQKQIFSPHLVLNWGSLE